MLSIEMTIMLLAGIAVVLGAALFILLRKTKSFAIVGFVFFGALAVLVYIGLPHVYILDDELEGRYEEKIVLFSSEFTFKDGSTTIVEPTFAAIVAPRFDGMTYPVIVNNTNEPHTYSVQVYSSDGRGSTGPRPVVLRPYTVNSVRYSPYYIYRRAPSSITTIRMVAYENQYRGVIR